MKTKTKLPSDKYVVKQNGLGEFKTLYALTTTNKYELSPRTGAVLVNDVARDRAKNLEDAIATAWLHYNLNKWAKVEVEVEVEQM